MKNQTKSIVNFGINKYYSIAIVADVLGVSKKTVNIWRKNGKLIPQLDPELFSEPYSGEQLLVFKPFLELFQSKWYEEQLTQPTREYSLVELFAGGGGLAIGLEQAGFKSLLLNEKDKHACATLRNNRPDWNVIEADIADISFTNHLGQVDLLTGGFPCQPFSSAGKQRGFEDMRGTLVFEMLRAIMEIQPKVFLAENVKGLAENNDGQTLKTIIFAITKLGYTVIENSIYKAHFYKTPQKRERLIIIAVRNDLADLVQFIKPSPYHKIVTVRDALFSGELYSCDVPFSIGQAYPKQKAEIMSNVPAGGYWRDLPLELQKEYMQGSLYLGGGKTGFARRLAWDEPSPTLTCSPAQKKTERCHPIENRPLTTREYARIQTFPDDWEFSGHQNQIYKQIGNAVPVNMARALGSAIVKMLNQLD